MSPQKKIEPDDDKPESRHLIVEPYEDDERVDPPDWYKGDTQ